jgi:hypothetical protein
VRGGRVKLASGVPKLLSWRNAFLFSSRPKMSHANAVFVGNTFSRSWHDDAFRGCSLKGIQLSKISTLLSSLELEFLTIFRLVATWSLS